MWFWSYTSRSTKRDYISNLTSALASYDDHDLNHDREEDYNDKDNNDDYDCPNNKDNHKKQMPDQDWVVYHDHSNLLFESSNNAAINVIPTERLLVWNSFTIGANDDKNVDTDGMNKNRVYIPTKPSATSLVAEDLDSNIIEDFDPVVLMSIMQKYKWIY